MQVSYQELQKPKRKIELVRELDFKNSYVFMEKLQLENMSKYYSAEDPISPLAFYYACQTSINFIIKVDDQPAGFIRLNMKDKDTLHISDIQIAEKFQGQGVGFWTMLSIEESARVSNVKWISLYVFKENIRAEKFYILLGFIENKFEKPQTENQKVYMRELK